MQNFKTTDKAENTCKLSNPNPKQFLLRFAIGILGTVDYPEPGLGVLVAALGPALQRGERPRGGEEAERGDPDRRPGREQARRHRPAEHAAPLIIISKSCFITGWKYSLQSISKLDREAENPITSRLLSSSRVN